MVVYIVSDGNNMQAFSVKRDAENFCAENTAYSLSETKLIQSQAPSEFIEVTSSYTASILDICAHFEIKREDIIDIYFKYGSLMVVTESRKLLEYSIEIDTQYAETAWLDEQFNKTDD